jgi:hypothetical protein
MAVPALATKFVGLSVTLIETPCKVAINATYQNRQDARKLEEWLEIHQLLRFVMLGINIDSYNSIAWVTYHLLGI